MLCLNHPVIGLAVALQASIRHLGWLVFWDVHDALCELVFLPGKGQLLGTKSRIAANRICHAISLLRLGILSGSRLLFRGFQGKS